MDVVCLHSCDVTIQQTADSDHQHNTPPPQNKTNSVAHCPSSNFMLGSGVLNVRRLLQKGIKVTHACMHAYVRI